MVAPGTHKQGHLEVSDAIGAGGRKVTVNNNTQWHWNPMKMGDVLLVHSLTVHQGKDNIGNHMRLSADFRYQPLSDIIFQGSLNPHMKFQSWKEIYDFWDDSEISDSEDPIRFYWDNLHLNVVKKNMP